MSPLYSAPQTVGRGWQIFNYTAMLLALLALVALNCGPHQQMGWRHTVARL